MPVVPKVQCQRDGADLDRRNGGTARGGTHQPQQDGGAENRAIGNVSAVHAGCAVCGTNNAGIAPRTVRARTAKTGEIVPKPDAATGASTKVSSLSVAEIPSARGNREAGANWLSTGRRYPNAAPLTVPARAATRISQMKDASYATHSAISPNAKVRKTTNCFRKVAEGRFLPYRVIGMAPPPGLAS